VKRASPLGVPFSTNSIEPFGCGGHQLWNYFQF
jgi:hypothetical protein